MQGDWRSFGTLCWRTKKSETFSRPTWAKKAQTQLEEFANVCPGNTRVETNYGYPYESKLADAAMFPEASRHRACDPRGFFLCSIGLIAMSYHTTIYIPSFVCAYIMRPVTVFHFFSSSPVYHSNDHFLIKKPFHSNMQFITVVLSTLTSLHVAHGQWQSCNFFKEINSPEDGVPSKPQQVIVTSLALPRRSMAETQC
jgi:hypothetical protein